MAVRVIHTILGTDVAVSASTDPHFVFVADFEINDDPWQLRGVDDQELLSCAQWIIESAQASHANALNLLAA